MLAVFKRDLFAYFRTPVGYVFVAAFLAANGGIFSMNTLLEHSGDISSYFTMIIFVAALLLPFLTMKLFAEERRMKTDQLILVSPSTLGGIVFGKFLAAFTVFFGTVLVGCINFGSLSRFAAEDQPNGAVIFGSVIALLLVGAAFIAVGIFVSSLTENQLIAAIGSIGISVLFLVIGMLNSVIPVAWLKEVLSWVSIFSRFGNFAHGVFDFTAVLYYASICFVFLFLTVRICEKRRRA
ncbi:MAG: ABC transporter permease subunit [Clostridia bacterium]|nr:ABC transporter permease subunit [Clostridia bacterium]